MYTKHSVSGNTLGGCKTLNLIEVDDFGPVGGNIIECQGFQRPLKTLKHATWEGYGVRSNERSVTGRLCDSSRVLMCMNSVALTVYGQGTLWLRGLPGRGGAEDHLLKRQTI